MDITTAVHPVTALKSDSARLIRRARETGQPIVITQNGKPSAVLVDVESYARERKAFALLKILSQGDADYRAGRVHTHEQAKKRLAAKLTSLPQS